MYHTALQEAPMNNTQAAYAAYDKTAKAVEAGYITDAVVLEKSALMMEELKRNIYSPMWADILERNNLIWTTIQVEMVDSAKHLPDQIKANIVSLSIFVDKRTIECLHKSERSGKDLDVLININRQIALGLRGDSGNTEQP